MAAILSADTRFTGVSSITLKDFWAWAYSDVLSNRNRSILAEFLVGYALGVLSKPRVEWDGVDLQYKDIGIEVKASGYIQSWQQARLSRPQFEIGKKRAWDSETNKSRSEPVRISDCYIFCLHVEKRREIVNPMDLSQWEFYVVARTEIDQKFGDQKKMSLSQLQRMTKSIRYAELRSEVDSAIEVIKKRASA